jgi:hypothetical protein
MSMNDTSFVNFRFHRDRCELFYRSKYNKKPLGALWRQGLIFARNRCNGLKTTDYISLLIPWDWVKLPSSSVALISKEDFIPFSLTIRAKVSFDPA